MKTVPPLVVTMFDVTARTDRRGAMVAVRSDDLSFPIAQVFYVLGERSLGRGVQAHKNTIQAAVCLNGTCRVTLSNGFERKDVILNDPGKALLLDKLVWNEIADLSPGCVVAIHSSEVDDPADYIRGHKEFMDTVRDLDRIGALDLQ